MKIEVNNWLVNFINSDGESDETELSTNPCQPEEDERFELWNLILSLKEEMDIKQVLEITFNGTELVDDYDEDSDIEEYEQY